MLVEKSGYNKGEAHEKQLFSHVLIFNNNNA